jgi:transposase
LPHRLPPLIPAGLSVVQVLAAPDRVTIVTVATPSQRACPLCGGLSGRVHSRYTRTLADLPWQGRAVAVQVRARRFRCATAGCPRRIFAERLPEVARPRARRTARLVDVQRHIGFALGGEPGARLAGRLAMPVSGDTLLRMVRSGAPAVPAPPPRVIGVDDWAWRRGRRYGTIICDLERRRVVDLLPDRGGDTLASWLKRHGGEVAVVSRDRSGAYAEGIRAGAPAAVQVADRWHLLANCSDALRQLLDRHQRRLREAARVCAAEGRSPAPTRAPPRARTPARAERQKAHRRERRQARYEAVAELHRQGEPIRGIARRLGVARNAVRRWLRAGEAAPYRRAPGRSVLDRHLGHVERRWAEGCRNAAELWRELREGRGFEGGYDVVRRWAIRQRALEAACTEPACRLPSWRVPSSRRAARLLTTEAASLSQADRRFVTALVALSPDIREAADLANGFARLVRERDADGLAPWLDRARATGLRGFAQGLLSDIDAVRAALSLPWSNGPAEGQINRLKLLKRQMYGRAKFDLLRSRVLHAA